MKIYRNTLYFKITGGTFDLSELAFSPLLDNCLYIFKLWSFSMRKKKTNKNQTFEFSDFPGKENYFILSLIGFLFLACAASSIWGLLLFIRKRDF